MEINKLKAVKLRSHLDKYLIADDDCLTVRQSRNSATRRSIWLVIPSPIISGAVRLKNHDTGLYLTASDAPFMLGWTGKKVIQSTVKDAEFGRGEVDWKAERDAFQMRLRTAEGEGKLLRANGGTPPWRNSVTHDLPVIGATNNWTLWDMEAIDVAAEEDRIISPAMSLAWSEDLPITESFPASPTRLTSANKSSAMDLFTNANTVRLRSHHNKYLTATTDQNSVTQHRTATSRTSLWTVEITGPTHLRLKNCHGNYLTASPHPFILGATGSKVLQTLPRHLTSSSSSVDWEPISGGGGSHRRVKLRSAATGTFLRANGRLPPPWRNSVTHDVPHYTATLDWILWDVHVIEVLDRDDSDHLMALSVVVPTTPPPPLLPRKAVDSDSFSSETSFTSSSDRTDGCSRQQSSESIVLHSPPKLGGNGRVVYYQIVDEHGNIVNDENGKGNSLNFKGNNVKELTHKLEKYSGIQDIIVCTRSPLNGKLCPLRLQLPPNTLSMHVVVVPSTSLVATNLETMGVSC